MKTSLRLAAFVVFGAASTFAHAAAAESTVAKFANWTVVKTTDAMTDKTACTAIYSKAPNVAMLEDRLVISMKGRGGIKGSQFRFDQEPASGFAPPVSDSESEIWWFGDMQRIGNAQKMLVRIEPIIGRIIDIHIDLKDGKRVIEALQGPRCR